MKEVIPSPELYLKIMKRLRKEERILAVKKVLLFSILFTSSAMGMVSAVKLLISQMQSSGFFYFVSLIFSDFSIVKAYWQNFLLATLEAMPAVSRGLCFLVLLVLMQSAKIISKNAKKISNINRLAIN